MTGKVRSDCLEKHKRKCYNNLCCPGNKVMSMKKRYLIFPTVCILAALLLEGLSIYKTEFTVFYTERIFGKITVPLAALNGLLPFSAGEILLCLAVLILATALLLGIGMLLVKIFVRGFRFPLLYRKYLLFIYYIAGIYLLIMVLNCFILYQYPPMQRQGAVTEERTRLLTELRDTVVVKANELAELMERDESGYVKVPPRKVLERESKEAMQRLSQNGYPRLSGYYPDFKYFNNSAFFSQQYMTGYYFPFSMEANINELMYGMNIPYSVCHELSHLKGYIREDEANFIAYLACIESEDMYFKYSALLGVLGYLDNDFYRAVGKDINIYQKHPAISDRVRRDCVFLTEETWRKVNEKSLLDTETVKKASNTFTEGILKSNGVSEGMKSYSNVVSLLLDYYASFDNDDNVGTK